MYWLYDLLLKIFPNYPEYKKRSEEKKELKRRKRFIGKYSDSKFAMRMYYSNETHITLAKRLGVRAYAIHRFARGYVDRVSLKLVIWYLAETYKDFDDIQFYKIIGKEQPTIPDAEYNYLMSKITKAYKNSLHSQTNDKVILYDMLIRFSRYKYKTMRFWEFDIIVEYLSKDDEDVVKVLR